MLMARPAWAAWAAWICNRSIDSILEKPRFGGAFLCAPSMGAILEVQVLCVSDHRDRSEAQLREGDRAWEGSVKRSDGPTNRNRIEGDAERGERAKKRKSR